MKDMNIGKVPPSSISLEKAVLGAIIIEPKAFLKVSDILSFSDFYVEPHQIIMSSIQDLFLKNQKIDLLTIVTYISKIGKIDEVGGAYYISTLTENIASAAHIEQHALEIVDLAIKRKIIVLSSELADKSFDLRFSTDDILDLASNLVDKAAGFSNNKSEIKPFSDNLASAIDYIKEKQNFDRPGKVSPVLQDLRSYIPEWSPGEVVVIAGRPGMAKTSYALFELYEQAKRGHAGAFFSLEMQTERLVTKCIQAETGLTTYDFERRLNSLEWNNIDSVYENYNKLSIFIDDTPLASFTHIKTKAKLLKDRYDIRFIVIDYLQLMGGTKSKNGNREEFISEISRNMKALSKELSCTIFVLSQLNRGVESRSDKRPFLSDLRESGAIEQDADIVLFPFRGEYYWPDVPDLKQQGIIIIAKNRNGETGDARMSYNVSVTKFMDIETAF